LGEIVKKTIVALAICVLLTVSAHSAAAESAKASGPFRIDKIRYQQAESLNTEYVVIKNVSHRKHNLKDYRIVDPLDGQEYTFARTIVKPGQTVTLHTGRGRDRIGHRYWRQDEPMWNNDGDTALLTKPGGATADRCTYDGTEGGTADC
jgi:hypothetical protein